MTFTELETLGRGLYGRSWKAQIASDLEIDLRRITTWKHNGCPQWLTKATLQPIVERRYNEVKQVLFWVGE